MATKTQNLRLTLPNLGEYNDSWHVPNNGNFSIIDDWAGDISNEILAARFDKGSLNSFLVVGHNPDGTLKPTEEVEKSRNSPLYGHKDVATAYTVDTLMRKRDLEIWRARLGQGSLHEGNALDRSFDSIKILSGSKNVNGYPSWAGFTANKVNLDGSAVPLYFTIQGKVCRIRNLKELQISGAPGTYYVYAQYSPEGEQVFASLDGETGLDNLGEARIHRSIGVNFPIINVKVGDLLKYSAPTSIAGSYVIEEIAPDGNNDRLKIVGLFPEGSISAIDFSISDPLGVTLGYEFGSEVGATDRGYLLEADFDGTAVTAVRPRHFGEVFVGEWRAVDITSVGTFEESWSHKVGTDQIDVVIQVSQANDGTQPVEHLSLSQITDTLAVSAEVGTLSVEAANTLSFTPSNGTLGLTLGDQALTGSVAGSLTGGVTASLSGQPSASLTGSIIPSGSVRMKATRNQVWIKNLVPGVFYKDYDNIPRQTGFIRVIVSKKG